jgi:hypothetical protein
MKQVIGFLVALLLGIFLIQPTTVRADEELKVALDTAKLIESVPDKPDNRAEKLKLYLTSQGSPMADAAEHFIKEGDRLGLDWKLVAAIAGNESSFGQYIPDNSFNAWGWGVWTGWYDGQHFGNWEEGITTVSEGLKEDYIDQGFTTVEQIGSKYAADWEWAWKVGHFMEEIEAFNPYTTDERLLVLSL